MKCPHCGNAEIVKHGFRYLKDGRHVRYKCKNERCLRWFRTEYRQRRIPQRFTKLLLGSLSMKKIADGLMIAPSQVKRWLERDDFDNDEIRLIKIRCIQLYLQGFDEIQIAKISGLNNRIISKWLSRFTALELRRLPRMRKRPHHEFFSVGYSPMVEARFELRQKIIEASFFVGFDFDAKSENYSLLRFAQLFLNGVTLKDLVKILEINDYEELNKMLKTTVSEIRLERANMSYTVIDVSISDIQLELDVRASGLLIRIFN